jgi:hypothetical protein
LGIDGITVALPSIFHRRKVGRLFLSFTGCVASSGLGGRHVRVCWRTIHCIALIRDNGAKITECSYNVKLVCTQGRFHLMDISSGGIAKVE